MTFQVNPQAVIDNLSEQIRGQTVQLAMAQAYINDLQGQLNGKEMEIRSLQLRIESLEEKP